MSFYKITSKSAKEADISIYGDIGESYWGEESVSASQFKKDIDSLGDVSVLNISINSPGGAVFDGLAIYNILKRHKAKKKVCIDGLAASAASFIAMAGDTITIPENAYMMVHRASMVVWGNADEFAKAVEFLGKMDETITDIYVERTKQSKDTVSELMDKETWMNGKEAVELGFADNLEQSTKIAACVGSFAGKYRNMPKNLVTAPVQSGSDLYIYQQDFELMKRRIKL